MFHEGDRKVADSPIFLYNFNPKGMIIFPDDDKQIILLYTSMRNNNPELQYTGKKKIPKHNTIWEK